MAESSIILDRPASFQWLICFERSGADRLCVYFPSFPLLRFHVFLLLPLLMLVVCSTRNARANLMFRTSFPLIHDTSALVRNISIMTCAQHRLAYKLIVHMVLASAAAQMCALNTWFGPWKHELMKLCCTWSPMSSTMCLLTLPDDLSQSFALGACNEHAFYCFEYI